MPLRRRLAEGQLIAIFKSHWLRFSESCLERLAAEPRPLLLNRAWPEMIFSKRVTFPKSASNFREALWTS